MAKIKEKINAQNLICLFIILCPILDSLSFLFRNHFITTFSPSTILRPIIPCILFIYLFFKEKNKKQKIIISLIYGIYGIIHLFIFQKLRNESSSGTLINELQYIANYSFMIINLYLFYKIINNKEKLQKTVFITLSIYILILILSIITGTSSSTYLEGMGYKGFFESGNSLCTVLLLSLCVILSNFNMKDWKKLILIILTGIYLCAFSGMRTGLFGFGLILVIFVLFKLFISIRDNIIFSKKQIVVISGLLILIVCAGFIFGSNMLERRRFLKENEEANIDTETMEKRYVTGDILKIYKQIEKNELPENFMTEPEKKAVVDLCEFAKKIKLSNVNVRAQQLIYNAFLVKEQKDFKLILFGNGFKNQTGELRFEMEVPSLLCNFGLIGFILYFGPFGTIFIFGIYKIIKTRKTVNIETLMCFIGSGLAIALSILAGYVYYNFSSMTIAILLNVLLLKNLLNKE